MDADDVRADETLREVVAALSVLPVVSEAEVQRIVQRAAGRKRAQRVAPPRWLTAVPLAVAATLVLAAGVGGFLLNEVMRRDDASPATAAQIPPAGRGAPVTAVAGDALAEAPIGTQFVLDAPSAASVALVGAFNGWDPAATPLVRDPATGLWTTTVPLTPGRHIYAFMVDDSMLTLDPRAPQSQDPDLGTTGSVVLVGAP